MEVRMEINGEKVGLYYSIGADCDIEDEMEKVACPTFPAFVERLGSIKAYAKLAVILNKWHCLMYGGEPIKEKDILLLPSGAMNDLLEAVDKPKEEGRKNEIKAKPVKGKKEESAAG